MVASEHRLMSIENQNCATKQFSFCSELFGCGCSCKQTVLFEKDILGIEVIDMEDQS